MSDQVTQIKRATGRERECHSNAYVRERAPRVEREKVIVTEKERARNQQIGLSRRRTKPNRNKSELIKHNRRQAKHQQQQRRVGGPIGDQIKPNRREADTNQRQSSLVGTRRTKSEIVGDKPSLVGTRQTKSETGGDKSSLVGTRRTKLETGGHKPSLVGPRQTKSETRPVMSRSSRSQVKSEPLRRRSPEVG
ncbi:hypothetical protein Acr_24g0006980 [Actinidia rufa]|uniref:Uncharacterized protein n=1 Tax=Actinidia rufa TaxID=165716 RepID=A0A7J0GUP1_9ERIC|nr:hypothetical protein Acr_24g0006980 [Actinidia rufa]